MMNNKPEVISWGGLNNIGQLMNKTEYKQYWVTNSGITYTNGYSSYRKLFNVETDCRYEVNCAIYATILQ